MYPPDFTLIGCKFSGAFVRSDDQGTQDPSDVKQEMTCATAWRTSK